MMPLAPLRLSMTMFWPSSRESGSDSARALVSMVPPAGCGMIMRIGRLGNACPHAAQAAAVQKRAILRAARLIMIV
jgi:hypothetical protein